MVKGKELGPWSVRMRQTKRQSLSESIVNVVVGYLIAVGSQVLIFPFFDIVVTIGDNLLIGLWFTMVSILRSYLIRRYYNAKI